jgi:hypothetical protein
MNAEAIGRVPLSDWAMAAAVLVCGVVAIAATWRYTRFVSLRSLAADNSEGGLGDEPAPQLALPPGPPNHVIVVDDVDRALWELIDGEYERGSQPHPLRRQGVLDPASRELAA